MNSGFRQLRLRNHHLPQSQGSWVPGLALRAIPE